MHQHVSLLTTKLSHKTYMAQRRFGALDGMRCFAVLSVVWHHSNGTSQFKLLNSGWLGVDLFFVISGFLIVTLLLRERYLNGDINLRNFYMRRVLRIFPPYYALLGALAIVYGLMRRADQSSELFFSLLPVYLFYVSNWSLNQAVNLAIFWSLATEEQFYLFWPPIQKWVQGKVIWIVILIGILVNQMANFGAFDRFFIWLYESNKGASLSVLNSTFTPILLGVALAHLFHAKGSFTHLAPILGNRFSAVVFLVLLLLTINYAPPDISGLPILAIHLLMTALVGSLTIREDAVLHPVFSHAVPAFIGSISYGMYLYHMWALHIARIILTETGVAFPSELFVIGTILTVAIAWTSYQFFERYFLSWKTVFSRSMPRR